MTLAEYRDKVRAVREDLERSKTRILAGYGFDLIALIQERIQTKGEDPYGTKLKEYSAGYLAWKKAPQNTKRGKELNLGSSRFSGVVDYTLTGRMWNNIGVIAQSESESSAVVTFGGKEQLSKDKLGWLAARDGEVLEPSEEELERAMDNVNMELERIMRPIK